MRRFFNGILVGSLIGAIVGLVANDNMKPQRKKIMGKTKKMSNNASRMLGNVSTEVLKMMRKR